MKERGKISSSDERTYTTRNGRPIRELNADPDLLSGLRKKGILFKEASGLYQDSRKKHPEKTMNVSALEEVRSEEQELFDGFSWMRKNYFDGKTDSNMTAKKFEELSRIPLDLPSFLVLRKTDPLPADELPDIVGIMYKAAAGINAAAASIKRNPDMKIAINPENVYTFADNHNLLINGKTDRVCSAPKKLIVNSIEVLMHGHSAPPAHSELDALIPNFAMLRRYSELGNEFEETMTKIVAIREKLTEPNADVNYLEKEKMTLRIKAIITHSLLSEVLQADPKVFVGDS